MTSRLVWALPLVLVAALVSGCDASSKLFSEAERRSIYTLSLESEGTRLASSSVVQAGAAITVSLSRMSGTTTPESLELALIDSSGASVASLRYSTPKDAKAPARAVAVADLSSALPTFALPDKLSPGVYSLVTSLRDSAGALLQEGETVLFVGEKGLGLGSLSLYPPTAAPSSAVLLSVAVKAEAEKASPDAWLAWSADGRVFAEGRLGDGLDKAVWTAPARDGAYVLDVDLYPAKPAAKLARTPSPWHQEIKGMVSSDAALPGDEFSSVDNLAIHLAFASDLSDSGTRAQAAKPSVTGKPSLESYPGGFGYRLGPEARILLPGASPPQTSKLLGPTTLLWRIYASEKDGLIYRLASEAGSDLLVVGLESGQPYVETLDQAGRHRSSSGLHFAGGLLNLALDISPENGRYRILWSLDGQTSEASSLPASSLPAQVSSILGGAASLPGVWDEFAAYDSAKGSPALFFAAAARAWRKDLILAEGFEAQALPASASLSGRATAGSRRLVLSPGASLVFSPVLTLARPLSFSLAWDPASAPPSLDFLDEDKALLFRVSALGKVSLGDGSPAGSVTAPEKGVLAFTLRSNGGSFEIAAKDSLLSSRFTLASAPSSAVLSLSNPDPGRDSAVLSVLARVATDAVSLKTVPQMAKAP